MKFSKWKAKAVVQKTISFLPMKARLNFLLQKHVTKGVLLTDSHFEIKLSHARDHLQAFREHGAVQQNFSLLEIGTGWYPIIPISMFLSGAGDVLSADIQSWMTKQSMMQTIRFFLEWRRSGRLDEYLPKTREDRWQTLEHIVAHEERYGKEWICGGLRLTLLLGDLRKAGLASQSIDYICSNNTFEHIHTEVLNDLLLEFGRVIKKGGVMSHFIDMTDHFAHYDPNITIYNFLKFSEPVWRRIDNSIQPMNRLRFIDYKRMYSELHLPMIETGVRPGNPDQLAGIAVAEKFKRYPAEELAVSHGYLVSPM